jgi:hypothetical protein
MRRTSQTIAVSLRQALYLASKGATFNVYPEGPGTRPARAAIPEDVRRGYATKRQALLKEWREVDPEGFRLWKLAMAVMVRGQEKHLELLTGWAAEIQERDGIRLVDPCAYCKTCRTARAVATKGEC